MSRFYLGDEDNSLIIDEVYSSEKTNLIENIYEEQMTNLGIEIIMEKYAQFQAKQLGPSSKEGFNFLVDSMVYHDMISRDKMTIEPIERAYWINLTLDNFKLNNCYHGKSEDKEEIYNN